LINKMLRSTRYSRHKTTWSITPVLEPITHPSTIAGEALSKIIEAIVTGEFKPGERISEAEIARQLGISRGPLREALGRLENRLVTRTPRVGVQRHPVDREGLSPSYSQVREGFGGDGMSL
jgi:DNA-binding GntR family transcriptional regulator